MTKRSDVRYARSTGGVDIAYQIVGEGPVDLVFVSGFITHLDLAWDLPHFSWLDDLDGIARVITFDKRGTGLSDRSLGFGSLEERADDIRAVMDAAESEAAFLHGVSEGGPLSILFAATVPERLRGLILYGSGARFSQTDDYPFGHPPEITEPFVQFVESMWGSGEVFGLFIQNARDDDAARRLISRFERNACTPKMAAEIMRRNVEIDVRPLLAAVTAPTLVVHCTGDPVIPIECGRYLVEHVPDARFVEVQGDFHGSWRPEDIAPWKEAVIDFLGDGGATSRPTSRVLATVLFTDIVGSTEQAARVGDDAWRSLLDQHDRIVERAVDRFGGRIVKTTGDGVLATFDGPGRAIACSALIGDWLSALGLPIRAGVHTGEVEVRGEDVAGMGVVIARRICDLGEAGDVLVSRTVKELVTGSGIVFADLGGHVLKGVPDEWSLFSVVSREHGDETSA